MHLAGPELNTLRQESRQRSGVTVFNMKEIIFWAMINRCYLNPHFMLALGAGIAG
jgi:hypothetical protein